jgi:hypothetical protein
MLNNHAKAQTTSLSSPVLRRNTENAQKPAKDKRRVTVAHAHATDKDASTRAPRTDKSVSLPRNHRRSNTPALLQKFDGQIGQPILHH